MHVNWSIRLDRGLRPASDASMWETYHECSKLPTQLALWQSTQFELSSVELFLTTRGFRQFRDRPTVELPEVRPEPADIGEVMRTRRSSRDLSAVVPVEDLAGLLGQAMGPTAAVHDDETGLDVVLRAWPSAGGLYPLDTYVVAQTVGGMPEGVYHYDPLGHRLQRLEAPDPVAVLREGFFWQEFVCTAAAVVLLVAVVERTTAKYGERGYRLLHLDAGHAGQNLLLTAEQLGLRAVAVGGFDDDALAGALGLDGLQETVVHAIVAGGRGD